MTVRIMRVLIRKTFRLDNQRTVHIKRYPKWFTCFHRLALSVFCFSIVFHKNYGGDSSVLKSFLLSFLDRRLRRDPGCDTPSNDLLINIQDPF